MFLKDNKEKLKSFSNEKPKFKDLVAVMIAQYLILIPMALIGLIIFGIVLFIFMKL